MPTIEEITDEDTPGLEDLPPLEDLKLSEPERTEQPARASASSLSSPPILSQENREQERGETAEEKTEEPLMDSILAAAKAAKREKEKKKAREEKKETKSFGSGFKKGFFQSKSTKEKRDVRKDAKREGQKEEKEIPIIRKRQEANSSLILPEVQQSMTEEQKRNPLEALSANTSEWMTPELMMRFSQSPLLARAFQDPEFMRAISMLQNNPTQALAQYKDNSFVTSALMEFMKIMGDHFEKLGQKNGEAPNPSSPSPAILSESERKKFIKETLEKVPLKEEDGERDKMRRILEDEELQQLLADPELRQLLHRCAQDPGALRDSMRDEKTARKIRQLLQAGLIKIEQ